MANKRQFNKKALIILLCGISIQVAGWFGEHCVEIPFVLKFVAPAYYHSQNGLHKLLSAHGLGSSDDGFKELAPLALDYIKNQHEQLAHISGLTATGLSLATKFSPNGKGAIDASIVVVYLSAPNVKFVDNNFETMQFERLKDYAESLREPNAVIFCFVLFFIGTLIDIIAFFVESNEPVSQTDNSHTDQAVKPSDKNENKDVCASTHVCPSDDDP